VKTAINEYMERPDEMIKILFSRPGVDMNSFSKSCSMSIFDLKHCKVVYAFSPNSVRLSIGIVEPVHLCDGTDTILCDCEWDAFQEAPSLWLDFTKAEVKKILAFSNQLKIEI